MDRWLNDSLFAALCSALLGIYALIRNPRHPVNLSFAAFLFSGSMLSVGSLTIFNAIDADQARAWGYRTRWALMFMPSTFLAFCLYFGRVRARLRRPLLAAAMTLSVALAALSFTPLMVTGFVAHGRFIKPTYGPAYGVFMVFMIACFLAGVWVLVRQVRGADPYRRNRIQLFILALVLGLGLGCAAYFLMHRLEYPLFALAVLISTPLMAYSFLKHRLLEVASYVRIGMSRVLVAVMLLPVFAAIVFSLGPVARDVPAATLALIAIALVGVALFFPDVRRWALPERGGRGRLPRGRVLARARSLIGLPTVTAVAQGLADLLVVEGVSSGSVVYLRDERRPGYEQLRATGATPDGGALPDDPGPHVRALVERDGATMRQDLLVGAPSPGARELADWMERRHVEVTVAVAPGSPTHALLLVEGPCEGGIYEPADVVTIELIAETAAVALVAARAFEATQTDWQIEELSATFAGIAHEFRNSLVPARTFLQLLPERRRDEEFVQGYRTLALERLERSFQLIRQFRDLHVERGLALTAGDLCALVRDEVERLRPVAGERGIELVAEVPDVALPCVCDVDQLSQALVNVLSNAIDHAGGRPVEVVLTRDNDPEQDRGERAMILVRNAVSIPAEQRGRIFQPFFTTKGGQVDSGSGLGLPIAQRIMHEHMGSITVRSTPEIGTEFTLSFPLRPSQGRTVEPPVAGDRIQQSSSSRVAARAVEEGVG